MELQFQPENVLDTKFGLLLKKGGWSGQDTGYLSDFNLKYMRGLPEYDEILVEKKFPREELSFNTTAYIYENGMRFTLQTGMISRKHIGIESGNIKKILLKPMPRMQQESHKVQDAVLGGLVLGPIGAILGALASPQHSYGNMLIIQHAESPLLFAIRDKDLMKVSTACRKYYRDIFEEDFGL